MIFYEGEVFTKDECVEILQNAIDFESSGLDMSVNNRDYTKVYLPNKRKSTQCEKVTTKGEFIYEKINQILKKFDYEISENELTYDVIKYQEGDFIWKHKDDRNNRLFSFVIQLDNDEDYTGGDFVYWINENELFMTRKQGFGMIFKAGVYHEVKPVVSGTRHSFVSFLRTDQIKKLSKAPLI